MSPRASPATAPSDLTAVAAAVRALMTSLGVPPESDPELRGSPERVAIALRDELLAGYRSDPRTVLADATNSKARGLVVLANVPTTLVCPHHLLPATGITHVGYWPSGKVVGLGALGALIDCHARRLVLQEDLASKIAHDLVAILGARASACVVDVQQGCVVSRGDRRHGARAICSAFAGLAERDAALRAEFLATLPRRTQTRSVHRSTPPRGRGRTK